MCILKKKFILCIQSPASLECTIYFSNISSKEHTRCTVEYFSKRSLFKINKKTRNAFKTFSIVKILPVKNKYLKVPLGRKCYKEIYRKMFYPVCAYYKSLDVRGEAVVHPKTTLVSHEARLIVFETEFHLFNICMFTLEEDFLRTSIKMVCVNIRRFKLRVVYQLLITWLCYYDEIVT